MALSFLPFIVLIVLISCCVAVFGNATLDGASQVSLLVASAVSVLVGHFSKRLTWEDLEREVSAKISSCAPAIIILLLIGAIGGTWMVSGIVPTMIYYGVQIMSPQFFLVSACVICSLVSVLSGSSWTTVATIGVALLGISEALGISAAWTAGAIISGAYFGDKMSPLSDTTILASSITGVDLFAHIRYMMYTTVPTFLITLIIFLVAGLGNGEGTELHVAEYTEGLANTFNISLWTLLVPVLTGILIFRRVSSLIVLFTSAIMAGVMALILQPHILHQIANTEELSTFMSLMKGLAITYYGATAVDTGSEALNDLVSTGGMAGMLNTIWLIVCAMCFGAVMVASGMIESITRVIIRMAKTRFSLVSTTVGTGFFLNITTGDQFISIVLTADMYRDAYRQQGYESRLLSRTTEDAATVTSVLVPWNTCGMTQAAVLGVPTLVYLPYCFFNIISPLMTLLVAAIGWKIKKRE